MSASISLKQKNVGSNFLKRTAGLITGAAGDYFHEAMPVTSSITKDVKDSAVSLGSTLHNTTRSVMPKIRQIKTQANVRNIMRWYMNSENEFSGMDDLESGLDFDIDIDDGSAAIAEVQISESAKNAKEISLSVVESSHRMVEAQISNTANILSSIDNQTAVITSGFNRVNDTLNKILEVVTKNTATMIETTVAAANSQKEDHAGNIINGKFNLTDYKKLIGNNVKNNPELGMMMAFLPMLTSPGSAKMFLTPENITSMLFSGVINKKAPNLKKNLQALDDAVNETIVDSLIRLGTNKSYGKKGTLARLLGIDPSRKTTDTSRSTLELKTVPFDSIAHESLTNTIPGYLRKILVQLGGEDLIYDYRSRSFKSKDKIRKEFNQAGAMTGSLNRASSKMQNAIGKDGFGNMVYDMMMADIGSNRLDESGRRLLESLSNPKKFEEYITGTVLKGMNLNKNELKRVTQMSRNFSSAARNDENFGRELSNQASRNNLSRNKRMKQYVDNANAYNVDLSDFHDALENEMKSIAESYGKNIKGGNSATVRGSKIELDGVNYTNAALYEIFTRLDRGINVFQVGSNNDRSTPFKSLSGRLPKPKIHRPKNVPDPDIKPGAGFTSALTGTDTSEDPNLLQNQTLEDGTVEDLSRGERFKRWGKKRGGNLGRALFSGNPEQVREAFGLIIRDVTQVAGDQVKKGAAHINNQFGNVSGYLKHKLFGTEYTFQDGVDKDGNPIMKKVEKNEKGGIFGFVGDYVKDMFKCTKEKGQKWFNTVKGYFDYPDNGASKEEKGVAQKRNKLLSISAGAFAGAGLLGGPIGLIMGAVAGNALSGLDIGSKIKGLLFGRDDKGKAKGLFTRLADGVVDPIKYQVGKTVHHLGNVLKKNVLGPLSDIGAAIRDRVTSSAESHFGKVFKAIGKIILAPFKGIGKSILSLAKLPITLAGGTARAGMSLAGGVSGSVLGGVANLIAGRSTHTEIDPETGEEVTMSTKKWLRQRRKDRNKDIKGDKYDNYKTWKQKENARRAELASKFSEYTKEEISEITAESTEQMAESTQEISDNVSSLTEHALQEGSIYTHDKGIHDRLDTIIDFFRNGGMKSDNDLNVIDVPFKEIPDLPRGAQLAGLPGPVSIDSESDDDNEVANNAMMAASVLAATGDEVSSEEYRLAGGIVDEAGKKKSNRGKIIPKLKELMGIQQEKKKTEGDDKKSFFSRIFDAVKGGFGGVVDKLGIIGTGIAGLLGIDEIKSFYNDVIKGDMSFAEWWGEESNIGKAVRGLMDVSKFVGTYAGGVVNMVSSGIGKLTKWLPFMPEINPPQINTSGPLAGIQAAILGGLYAKGASAIGSVVSAVANMISGGSNLLSNIPGGKGLGGKLLKGGAVALAGYSYLKGPEYHEDTDAAGNQIVDGDTTRGMRMPGTRVVVNSGINYLADRAGTAVGRRTMSNLANAGIDATLNKAGNITFRQGGKFASNAAISGATGMSRDATSKAIMKTMTNGADDVAKSKGAMGFVKTAINGIKNFLMKNKTFAKFAKAISTKLDDVLIQIAKASDSIIAKMPQKIAAIITKGGTKEAASVATAGIGYAVMAFGGALSGGLSAANIFGVRESDVNGTMRTIASVIVAMLNAVPGLWALELADLFIAPLTIRSILCSLLYGLLGGGDDLENKRQTFSQDLNAYNSEYGAELSTDEYNDMVNKGMFAKMFGKGAVKTDENGRAMFDEAGEAIRTNHGVAGWFAGGQKVYAHDENGAVLKDEKGKAVQAVDKYGRGVVEKKTWTNHVGDFFSGIGRWFAGGDEYEVDENGQAIRDKDGNYVVKNHEGNVFQRAGAGISNWWNGQEITNPDGTTTKTTGFKEAATKTLGNIGSTIAKPFKDAGAAISDWWSGDVEKDAEGNPLTDEEGNPIRKGGIKDKILSTAGKVNETIYHVSKHVSGKMKDFVLGEYELDENGNPLLDENNNPIRKGGIAGAVKSGIGFLNKNIISPVKDAAKGAAEWIGDKASWLGDKAKDVGAWISDKASSMWKSVSTPVKDAAKSAGNWIKNKASWLGDKAKDAGAWISEKAGNIWDTISTPVKDAASGVADWVKKKAGWVKDKAKDVGAWISDKAGTIFDSITDNIKGLAKGASDFVKDKVDWVKDGAKSAAEWIGDKAKGIWDWVTGGIKDMAESGKEYERKEQYIKNAQGKGGPAYSYAGIGGGDIPIYGGNPLSKPFQVTSGYGMRSSLQDNHKGVDIAPMDRTGKSDIVSRFDGTVISMRNDVPDSDTGAPYRGSNETGNTVIIKTSDGKIVKNYHMKAGSIPSNVQIGSTIHSGQKIGEVGSTGRSTGQHLHYQIEVPDGNGNLIPINPMGGDQSHKYKVFNLSRSRISGIGGPSINIQQKTSRNKLTSSPGRKIKYIVIHYTAGTTSKSGQAASVANYFATGSTAASADFIVDDSNIVQYNPDIRNYYTWHCGGSSYRHPECRNNNAIGIEICSSNRTGRMTNANDSNFYFTDAVVNNAINLTKYLMNEYKVPANNIIRHYDVTGKLCPGIKGWNPASGDESKWIEFRKKIGASGNVTASISGGSGSSGTANPEFAKWISVIKEVKSQFAAKKMGYNQGGWTDITVNGYTIKMRTDCSGFVSACVSCFSKSQMMEATGSMESDNHPKLTAAGFVKHGWPGDGWKGLHQGDIIVRSGHTEIFSHLEGNTPKVWNCGSSDSCNNPGVTNDSPSGVYRTVWRHKSSDGSVITGDGSYLDGSSSVSDSSSENKPQGILGILSDIGNKFLYKVTGGLIGSDGSSTVSAGTTDGGISTTDSSGSSGTAVDDGNAVATGNSSAKKGQTVTIPSGLGTQNSYMGWQCITSPSSNQYKLRQQAGQNFDSNGYGKINGRYVIATTTTYGDVGDYLDVYRADGSVLKAVIGDIKNQNDPGCNKWGHKNGNCITEFVVDKNSWYASDGKGGQVGYTRMNKTAPGSNSSAVTKIVNQGSYFGGVGGPIEGESKLSEKNFIGLAGDLDEANMDPVLGIGGPTEDNSLISSRGNKYSTPVKRTLNIQPSYSSNTVPQSTASSTSFARNIPDQITSSSEVPIGTNTDLTGVMNALSMILENLKQIASNTGSSTELLGSLNEKDFVDQGVRDSLNALKGKKHQSKRTSSPASARSVAAIARP